MNRSIIYLNKGGDVVKGYEKFKQLREETGYSVRNFATKVQISSRSLTNYENGKMQLTALPVEKCIRIFEFIKQDIPEFYYEYYPLKKEADKKLAEWKYINSKIKDFPELKIRIFNRLSKIRERKTMDEQILNDIFSDFNRIFAFLETTLEEDGSISSENYEKYVQPLLYRIRWGNEKPNRQGFGNCINDSLYMTDYSYKDLADFIGSTPAHLMNIIYGKYDFHKMHIGVALKLCYVLNILFDELFLM